VERRVADARREALVVRDPDGVPVELYRSRARGWLEPLTLG
jgi:catechol-2,3-dioxygenase